MRAFSYLSSALLFLPSLILADTSCSGNVTSSGDRNIALVIDASGSMADTDPNDLRLAAGRAIVKALLPSDRVAVIVFEDEASIVTPLGPPSNASFAGIEPGGGTYIAGGVETAINETLKDSHSTISQKTGVVVFTDGEDSDTDDLVDQLNRASSLGIRVSFGFLNPGDSYDTQDPAVLAAILGTNGIYSTIDSDKAQAEFVNLVLTHGLVDIDNPSSGATLLLPGLTTAGNASASSGPKVFTYDALPGEVLNFTVQAIAKGVTFEAKLRDKTNNKDIQDITTAAKSGFASIPYKVSNGTGATSLELDVSTSNSTGGLFGVQLVSNMNRTISVCGSTNSTSTNSTVNGGASGTKATASVSVSSTATSTSTSKPAASSGTQTQSSTTSPSSAAAAIDNVSVAKRMAIVGVLPLLMAVAI